MNTFWQCSLCAAENPHYRRLCIKCGEAPRADRTWQDKLEDWLIRLPAEITAVVGISLILGTAVVMSYEELMGAVLALEFFPLGFIAIRRARQKLAARADAVLADDRRPPILFVRSFVGDSGDGAESSEPPLWLLPFAPVIWLIWSVVVQRTQEERLFSQLVEFGPCVAVGRPGEALPELGFFRLYADEHQWHDVVAQLLERAQLVIVRASRLTDAVAWELDTIVKNVAPERVLVLLPFVLAGADKQAARHYDAFRVAADRLLPASLPGWSPDAVFVRFDHDWHAELVSKCGSLKQTLRHALKAVPLHLRDAYPERWKRLVAAVIDTIVLLAAGLQANMVVGLFVGHLDWYVAHTELVVNAIWLVIPVGLTIYCWRWCGSTLGKVIFDLRIVDFKTALEPKMWQWVARCIGCLLLVPTYGIGFFWMAVDRRRQAWHDKLAGTVVVTRHWRSSPR